MSVPPPENNLEKEASSLDKGENEDQKGSKNFDNVCLNTDGSIAVLNLMQGTKLSSPCFQGIDAAGFLNTSISYLQGLDIDGVLISNILHCRCCTML